MQGMLLIFKAEDELGLKQCMDVRNRVFTLEKNVAEDIEVDGNDTLGGNYEHFGAKLGDECVGAVRCFKVDEQTVKVQRFCVLAGYREKGIGKKMLEYIEAYYGKAGVKRTELDSKFAVCEFYEKCGYNKISDIFIEADVEHVKMEKDLNSKIGRKRKV